MRSLRAALACALVAATVAVPASAAPPTYVTGRVLDDAGRPVRGATVRLASDADIFGFPILMACSMFLFLPPVCRDATASAKTDAAGRYAIRVRSDSLVGRQGQKSLTIIENGTPAVPGAYTATNVYWTQRNLRVTDLRLWHAKPSVEPVGPLLRVVRREPLPAAFGKAQAATPSVYLLQGAGAVWRYADESDDHYADARTVEAGTTAVREVAVALVGHGYKVTYFSRGVPVSGGVKPVSRGASCAAYGEGDTLVALPGCRYTDGRLAEPVDSRYAYGNGKACRYPTARCAHPGWVRFDLGSPQVVQAAVVRGCTLDPNDKGMFPAEVSLEGTQWTPLLASNPWSDLVYAPPTPVRYVRVNLRSCAFPPSEVSVFGAA